MSFHQGSYLDLTNLSRVNKDRRACLSSLQASAGECAGFDPPQMGQSWGLARDSLRCKSSKAKSLSSLAADPLSVLDKNSVLEVVCIVRKFIESTFACRGEEWSPTIFLELRPSQIAST